MVAGSDADLSVMVQTGFATHISPISPGHQRYLSQAARPRIIARDSHPADNRDHLLPCSAVTTHVLLDITGFAVGSVGQVNPAVLPASATSAQSAARGALAARAAAGTLPKWYTGH
jgi:hypothetical protein